MNIAKRILLAAVLAVSAFGSAAQSKGNPILIGQTSIQTGPIAGLSTDPLIGIKALLNKVNAAGGVHGRSIDILQADDAYDSQRAAANVKRFAEAGAVAILMPIGTNAAVGALKAATDAKIPLVGPYSGAPSVAKSSPYLFPARIGYDEEYSRIVNHLFTIGIRRIAFAYADNPGARYSMEVTRRFIEERGEKMASSVAIQLDGSDAALRAQELAASRPSAVILSVSNEIAAKFVPAYRATGASTAFYSFSFLNGGLLHKAIGADAAGVVISQVVPFPWGRNLPLLAEYQEAMKKIGAADLSYGSLEGYLNAKILVEAIRGAGAQPTPEAVRKALESFANLDLGGIYVRYAPNAHLGLGYSELTQINRDGRYTR
ncbi:Receptor family ligand binding region [compost metagenome]